MRYAAFISYNQRDRPAALWLHRALETYRIPKRLQGHASPFGPLGAKLPPVFIDREELAASSDLAQSVLDALHQADALIVVCSPNAAKSRWVNEEIRAFSAMGRRGRIQCLIVSGEANASRLPGHDPADECLPPALFEQGGAEPLAADIRPGKDGKTSAKLKLIAGMTGLRYDDLRQRDHARYVRRLAIAATAFGIGFVVMAALAGFALVSRAQAVRDRDIARQKTVTAERTVDFVKSLFAVSDPSEARGATVTAREVLDRGAAQIRTGLATEPNVRAELATTLGEVYGGLGLYHDGEALIREMLKLPAVANDTRARQYAALGDGEYRQGNYAAAAASFDKALALARGVRPVRDDLVARALVGLSLAESARDNFAVADARAREALAIDRTRVGPRHPDVARDMEAVAINAFYAGKRDVARPNFEAALAIREATQGPNHPQVIEDLNALGVIAYEARDSVAAEGYYRRALAAGRTVLGPDHPEVAATETNLARILLERRSFAEAEPILQHAVDAMRRQRDDTYDDMSFLFANLAIAKRGMGKLSEAEALFERGQVAADLHRHRFRAPIRVDLADMACARGDVAEGTALLDAAAPVMAQDYPKDAWRSAWVEVIRAGCRAAAGDRAGARKLLDANAPAVAARWAPDTLYGARLAQIRAAAG